MVRQVIKKIVRKEDKLAQSLLSPQVNLVEALEVLDMKGTFWSAVAKALSIFMALWMMGFTEKVCAIISLFVFAYDVIPILAKHHRKAAAVAKILTLLGFSEAMNFDAWLVERLQRMAADGIITREEFIQLIRELIKRERRIVVEKEGTSPPPS